MVLLVVQQCFCNFKNDAKGEETTVDLVAMASGKPIIAIIYHTKFIHIFSYAKFQITGFYRFEDFVALICQFG